MTQGYLVGEVVRRITGRSLGTVFREEIAEPLGADFPHRPAGIRGPARRRADPARAGRSDRRRPPRPSSRPTCRSNPGVDVAETGTRAWRGAEIPAAGGTGNARSIAEIHAILANGGVAKGKRFMSEAGCRKALELQIEGTDLILGMPIKFGLGFGSPGAMIPLPSPNSMFWGGYGGSLTIIDFDMHATFGYAMNRWSARQGDRAPSAWSWRCTRRSPPERNGRRRARRAHRQVESHSRRRALRDAQLPASAGDASRPAGAAQSVQAGVATKSRAR